MLFRVRWWLARRIAPKPIMFDAFDGSDGVFVIIRQKGDLASLRSERFRLKSSRRLAQFDYRPDRPFQFYPIDKPFRRFVGTIG